MTKDAVAEAAGWTGIRSSRRPDARLRGELGPPRGTVLMNAGIGPGLTNLIAAGITVVEE
jgi:hypothetical protein